MSYPRSIQWLLISGICFLVGTINAAVWDTDKERTIADKLATELKFGELIWLQMDNNVKFPAIYTRPVYNSRYRAVILLHSMSAHMDWPVVIAPLRESFLDHKWTSLSIQLPVIATEKPPAEYSRTLNEASLRINRAKHFLLDQGYDTVVLVGYGVGATIAAYYLAQERTHEVHAFVGISMLARKYLAPQVSLLDYLEGLYLPTLDIYGSNDLPVVISTADDRRLFSQKNGTNLFSQIIIEGADHYFTGHEQTLFNRIIAWLETLDTN
jgi:pimeloyl-ACP methyl ester carboxylesterase